MTFELPKLSFNKDLLKPYLSEETIEFHYGKHHQTYVTNLNKLISDTEFSQKSLTEIVTTATGGIFNNAAQHLNHSFYWEGLTVPAATSQPATELLTALNQTYGSFEKFKEEFTKMALALFGSGWTWLIKNKNGEIAIINTNNAGNPITDGNIPLLTCDVWEHAYYIDYRNARAKYLENYWPIINWQFVNQNFLKKSATT